MESQRYHESNNNSDFDEVDVTLESESGQSLFLIFHDDLNTYHEVNLHLSAPTLEPGILNAAPVTETGE